MKYTVIKHIMFLSLLLALACIVVEPTSAAAGTQQAPDISSSIWLNSAPLRMADLRGKVVLVEFWTHGCSNCRNVEPYVKTWHEQYARRGLVIIGVHSPEFAYESTIENVQRYVTEHAIRHAVAIDNDFAVWNSYHNHFWPTLYLIDKRGMIRYSHIGEGAYDTTEYQIKTLLSEN